MDNIAILIPCYNEVLTIGKVIEDFGKYVPYATIYVYDNNSTDGTYSKAKSYESTHKVVVRKFPKQGKGAVVKQMFQDIDADIYVMIDGDGTYPVKDTTALIKGIQNGYDMMLGDRLSSNYFTENSRKFHGFGNKLVRYLVNTLYHGCITDVMTGFRAFNKKFVKSIEIVSDGFELETEFCIFALKNHYKIGSIPIHYENRPDGSISKLNTFSDGIKVIETIVKLK